jgi:hypothetical protein
MGQPRDAAPERLRLARLEQRVRSGRSGSGLGVILPARIKAAQRAALSQSSSSSAGSNAPGIAFHASYSSSPKVCMLG